jgi:hypothetical protein
MTTKVEMKLVETKYFTRWRCDVCGDHTGKVRILCEGYDRQADSLIRVCGECLAHDDIDGQLQKHADHLEEYAAFLRGFIGRLQVPTFAQWQVRAEAHELKWVLANTPFKTRAEYKAHEEAESARRRLARYADVDLTFLDCPKGATT